jgi:XTP/dITP diphosphohydrolase
MTGVLPSVDGQRRVVLATGNRAKAGEIRALLGPDWEVRLQGEFGVRPVEETGTTFLENALLKARHAAAATGWPAIADDSGIEVDALGGAPGVRSARFAGETASDADNLERLLAEMIDVAAERRSARFRCVIVLVRSPADPEPLVAEGCWEGRITRCPRGSSGFGYDPVFEDPATGLTAAELPAVEKNRRSHRGQATRALQRLLSGPE